MFLQFNLSKLRCALHFKAYYIQKNAVDNTMITCSALG